MRSVVPILFALAACDGPSSPPSTIAETTTVAIGSIGVAITVTSNGAAVLVDARVSTSGSMPLRLGPSDVLAAGATDAPARPLAEYAPGKYVLFFATQAPVVDLSFTRAGKIVSTTALALPTPFTIVPPTSSVRSKGIALGWAPGMMGEALALSVSGPCVAGMKLSRAPDPLGSGFTLQAADFSTTTGTCILDVEVTRTASQTTPLANFASGGGAKLVQSRTLEIVTSP